SPPVYRLVGVLSPSLFLDRHPSLAARQTIDSDGAHSHSAPRSVRPVPVPTAAANCHPPPLFSSRCVSVSDPGDESARAHPAANRRRRLLIFPAWRSKTRSRAPSGWPPIAQLRSPGLSVCAPPRRLSG